MRALLIRLTALPFVALLALPGWVLLSACETQELYVACKLDPEVTKKDICAGKSGPTADTSSCVVTQHPHCDQNICLSYFGGDAFCTRTCTTNADCPDGECWTYADASGTTPAKQYCVPTSKITGG